MGPTRPDGDGSGIAFGELNDAGELDVTHPVRGAESVYLAQQATAGKVAYVLYQPR